MLSINALVVSGCLVGLIFGMSIRCADAGIFSFLVGDDPAIKVCEFALKRRLVSPASYHRVAARIAGNSVELTFDAANAYNAIIRQTHTCVFGSESSRVFLAQKHSVAMIVSCDFRIVPGKCDKVIEDQVYFRAITHKSGIEYPFKTSDTALIFHIEP